MGEGREKEKKREAPYRSHSSTHIQILVTVVIELFVWGDVIKGEQWE
jgi:hypothetical protein